jgi:hypothetical protein
MDSRILGALSAALALFAAGCASISIDEPKDQSTTARLPQQVLVTQQGFVDYGDPFLDSFNLSSYNGQHWQYVPQSTLYYVPPGTHMLTVSAKDRKWHTNISRASSFTVSSCPLCYSCPVGSAVHPVTGQCCDNGMCDRSVFGNFGPPFYGTMKCQQSVFPSATNPIYWNEFDCISTQVDVVRGSAAGGQQMIALSFMPTQGGALRHVRAPIGLQSGANSLLVWITADASNAPGQVLESLTLNTVRQQPQGTSARPPVEAPDHIFFSGNTQLTAGTRYWLVLGPGAAGTNILWNLSLDDFSIPAATTYLVNRTNSSVAGPWTRKTPNLADQRPAFEVDVR